MADNNIYEKNTMAPIFYKGIDYKKLTSQIRRKKKGQIRKGSIYQK